MANTTRPGLSAPANYSPTPFALGRKALPCNNILIGTDPAQILFLAQVLRTPAVTLDLVTDETLLGQTGLLLQVTAEHRIDISSDVRSKTGLWDAGPIRRGSSAAHAIVRYAAILISFEGKLSREMLEYVSDAITKDGVEDVRGALARAAWILTGGPTPPPPPLQPWQDPVRWLQPGTDPEERLEKLYRDLAAWSLVATGEAGGARHLDVAPAEQTYLKTLHLDKGRVYQSIKQLSRWKLQGGGDPYCCALAIACIWRPEK